MIILTKFSHLSNCSFLFNSGNLDVDYVLETSDDASVTDEVVKGNLDLLTGNDNIVYNNQSASASEVNYVTLNGNNSKYIYLLYMFSVKNNGFKSIFVKRYFLQL